MKKMKAQCELQVANSVNNNPDFEVIAVGPGPLDEEGKQTPVTVSPGNTVSYTRKMRVMDFKVSDGSDDMELKATDM